MRTIKKYYSINQSGNEADIYIYGDITSWDWYDSDVSSYTLAKELEGLQADVINVYINSYGGEVAEGLAIHNNLKRHSATVRTYCDGFACSAASVVYMAGDERYMYPASLLMIHNAWSYAAGNANELRKTADDLDAISAAASNAYKEAVTITGEELQQMLDDETWIPPEEALEKGFATAILSVPVTAKASQSVRKELCRMLLNRPEQVKPEPAPALTAPAPAPEPTPELAPTPAPEPTPEPAKQRTFFNFKKSEGTK